MTFSDLLVPAELAIQLLPQSFAGHAYNAVRHVKTREPICFVAPGLNQNTINLTHCIATMLNYMPTIVDALSEYQDLKSDQFNFNQKAFGDYDKEALNDHELDMANCRHIVNVFNTLNLEGNETHVTNIHHALFETKLPIDGDVDYVAVVSALKNDPELMNQFLCDLTEHGFSYTIDINSQKFVSIRVDAGNRAIIELLNEFAKVLNLHEALLEEADEVEREEAQLMPTPV